MCAFDFFSKYPWVVPLKGKRGISIVNAFKKIVSKERKPNKIWFVQGGQFYDNLFNPIKAGLFEGTFSWGGVNLAIHPPPFIFQEELI